MQNQNDETTLMVEGMTCRSCVAHVDEALRELESVTSVEVRFHEKRVVVRHEPGAARDAFVAALRDAGYESTPVAA